MNGANPSLATDNRYGPGTKAPALGRARGAHDAGFEPRLRQAGLGIAALPRCKRLCELETEVLGRGEQGPDQPRLDAAAESVLPSPQRPVLRPMLDGVTRLGQEAQAIKPAGTGMLEFALGDAAALRRLDMAVPVGKDAHVQVGLVELAPAARGGADTHGFEILHRQRQHAQPQTDFAGQLAIRLEVTARAAEEDLGDHLVPEQCGATSGLRCNTKDVILLGD